MYEACKSLNKHTSFALVETQMLMRYFTVQAISILPERFTKKKLRGSR